MFTCIGCGKRFEDPKHPGRKYCAHGCAKRSYWRRWDRNYADHFWKRVEKTETCWLWRGQISQFGYGKLRYFTRDEVAHRVAWMLIRGAIPEGLFVLHHCDVRLCVNPAHLWLGTRGENNTDRARKGRSAMGAKNGNATHPESRPRGEQHAATKLTADQVRAMRAAYATGVRPGELARRFNVTTWNVYDVVSCRTWRHLE